MLSKIALIQPRVETGTSLGIEKSPASIQALAGQMSDKGHSVRMFHKAISPELFRELDEFAPEIVGISTMTANFLEGIAIAKGIKAIHTKVVIVLGGWHASGCVQSHLQGQESETIGEILYPNSPFDFVVAGEGEEVFQELVQRLKKGQDIAGLSGVCYSTPEGIKASTANRINDLDSLAQPSWEGLPINEYRDKRSGALDLSYHAKRACRFNCGFCATSTVYGKGVKTFSPTRVTRELEDMLKKLKPEVITFTDEDFFAYPKWVEQIIQLLEQNNLHEKYGVEFDTFASINDILRIKNMPNGAEFLKRMKKVGFSSFTIGIESMNPKVLRKYNKVQMITQTMPESTREEYRKKTMEEQDQALSDHHFEATQAAIKFAQANGIMIIGDYIVGNMGESQEDVKKGFEKFSSLEGLLYAYIPIFTPFPGTALWGEAYKSGKLARDANGKIDWSKFNASAGAIDLGYDIAKLRDEFEIQFYTSERYERDMETAIQENPARKTEFRTRLNYLLKRFGENPQLTPLLEKATKILEKLE